MGETLPEKIMYGAEADVFERWMRVKVTGKQVLGYNGWHG